MDTPRVKRAAQRMRGALFIDGAWRDARNRDVLPVINPADETIIAEIAAAGADDIDDAATAARRAFESGWGRTRATERAAFLRAIAASIVEQKAALSRLEVLDNGKPLPEAEWDIDDAAGCFEYYAELAEGLDAQQDEPVALPDARFESVVRREPVGVAGQIIPWNYPLLMAAWKVAPALAAGCTCVLKPSELTSLTALELAKIADACGLPAGVLNLVTGTGPIAGHALSNHRDIDKLAFTGSVPTGRRIMAAAAQDIKNISLELGGKSPFVVFADADLAQAVEWILFGIFWNQGQVCSATSRVLVERSFASRLIDALVEQARKIVIGDGLAPGTLLGPLVGAAQRDKVVHYIERARNAGVKLACGGGRPAHLDRGYFVEPTIFVDVADNDPIWREEVFGPVLAVSTFDDEAEAIRRANDTPYGLAAAVMSRDIDRCNRVARAFRAGIVWINCSQPTFTQAPWGGMKASGIGRELGRWGLENYLEVKQVTTYRSDEPWGWYQKSR
jgi:betaine-aldehyde dehydrogenase